MTVIIDNTLPDGNLDISELTEATLDGNGVLDVLLQTMRLHLDREFKDNRITGTAYATVYAQSIAVFLQQAIAYSLSKAKLSLELQHLKEQVDLVKLQQDQTIAQTNKITTDTVVAIKQGHLIDAQTCQVKAETNRINAEVALRLPEEVELIKRNQIHVTAQTDLVTSQDDLLEYDLLNKQPIEVQILQEQRDQLDAQTERTQYEVSTALPAEVANKTKQTDLLTYELTSIKPQELAIKVAQAELTQYELTQLKPKELELATKNIALAEKQIEAQEAQSLLYTQKTVTEKAQTDNTVVGANSVVDRQNKMMGAQTDGFKRDAEQKSTKLLIDTWSLRKNTDPDATPVNNVNKLVDDTIGAAIQKMMAGIDIVV